jgi:hypothetical protein
LKVIVLQLGAMGVNFYYPSNQSFGTYSDSKYSSIMPV